MKYPFLDLGLVDYAQAYQLQRQIWDSTFRNNLPGAVLLAEHNHVFTLGRLAKRENIVVDNQTISDEKIDIYNIERGGDVTYHGPGQIVIYPIINLKFRKKDLRSYVTNLEEVVICFLQHLGIQGFRRKDLRGVWTNDGKIASLGVAIRKWISFHGVAININPDKRFFSYIKPCGMEAKEMISLFDILGPQTFSSPLKPILCSSFNQVFN